MTQWGSDTSALWHHRCAERSVTVSESRPSFVPTTGMADEHDAASGHAPLSNRRNCDGAIVVIVCAPLAMPRLQGLILELLGVALLLSVWKVQFDR